jgi:hypothetical protein
MYDTDVHITGTTWYQWLVHGTGQQTSGVRWWCALLGAWDVYQGASFVAQQIRGFSSGLLRDQAEWLDAL